jgi:hypothetical protein
MLRETMARAMALGAYPNSSATEKILSAVSELIWLGLLKAKETAAMETPALSATSRMVARFVFIFTKTFK